MIPPDGTYVHDPSPVTIKDLRGCAGVAVVLAFDGHIRGRVVDANLKPLAGVTIDAVATGERVPSYWHAFVTDENGIYDIAKLTPGRYRVGVNVRREYSTGQGFGRPACISRRVRSTRQSWVSAKANK